RTGGRRWIRRSALPRLSKHDEGRTDLHDLAFLSPELEHLARDRRRDLDRDLVRHHFHDRVVLSDRVAFLDEPLDNLALVDALPDIGKLELAGHSSCRRKELSFLITFRTSRGQLEKRSRMGQRAPQTMQRLAIVLVLSGVFYALLGLGILPESFNGLVSWIPFFRLVSLIVFLRSPWSTACTASYFRCGDSTI